jgi:hypothetical protein
MALRVAERAKRARKSLAARRAPRRVRARRLAGVVALLGVVITFAFLTMPVEATVDDDPLMRLRTFDAAPATADSVECGTALGEARGSEGATLYDLAADDACRTASLRRALTAGAAGAVVVLSGLLAMAAASTRLPGKGAFA